MTTVIPTSDLPLGEAEFLLGLDANNRSIKSPPNHRGVYLIDTDSSSSLELEDLPVGALIEVVNRADRASSGRLAQPFILSAANSLSINGDPTGLELTDHFTALRLLRDDSGFRLLRAA